MASIADEIRESFKKGTMLTKLIYVNVGVFILVRLLSMFFYFSDAEHDFAMILKSLMLPADTDNLLLQPWTIFSYMILHYDFLHIIFNMLWLFWFGKIFLQYLDGKKMLGVYIIGGLVGAMFYVAAFNIFPKFENELPLSFALGASASVYAIVLAIATLVPNYTIYLMFFGPVKIKYIALFAVASDFLFMADGNAGGHIAHLGGAVFGILFIMQYRKGRDISKWPVSFVKGVGKLFKKRKPKMKVTHKQPPRTDIEYNKEKAAKQKQMNEILDKISESGYESLTKDEKEILFKMSNRN